MEKSAPRSHFDLPTWPSGFKTHPVKLHPRDFHSPETRPAESRLEKVTRRNLSTRSLAAEPAVDDALPGIPASRWNALSLSPSSHAKPAPRHRSVELPRPSGRRSRSYHDDVSAPRPMSGHSRIRTRTMEDGQRYTITPSAQRPLRRVDSIREMTASGVERSAGNASTIGHPSTVPFTYGDSQPTSSIHPDAEPAKTPSATRSRQRSVIQRTEPSIPKASRMQHLMNITRGRMHGYVFYRRKSSSRWHYSYCVINPLRASLVRESTKLDASQNALFMNLRGCRARCFKDDESGLLTLELHSRESPLSLYIRAESETTLFRWQAAFLCWQPATKQQLIGPATETLALKPLSVAAEPDLAANERISRAGRQPSIQKVGKLLFWYDEPPIKGENPKSKADAPYPTWKEVSCMIKDNGDFLVAGEDSKTITAVHLSSLTRSTIERVHESAYGRDNCIAIVPQSSRSPWDTRRLRPIVLSSSSRDIIEAWYVLIRAFATVEMYGPSTPASVDILRSKETLPGLGVDTKHSLCRVERFMYLFVNYFEDKRSDTGSGAETRPMLPSSQPMSGYVHVYHVEVLVEGFLLAKTRSKYPITELSFWENFAIPSIPPTASFVTFRLVQSTHAADITPTHSSRQTSVSDQTQRSFPWDPERQIIGETTAPLAELCTQSTGNRNVTLRDQAGSTMGKLSVKPISDMHVILLDQEYAKSLSDLLHRFSNSLTIEIADKASSDLLKVARCFTNIFQVSRKVSDWLMSLAEEEVDGVRKEAPAQRERHQFRSRINSNESKESFNPYGFTSDRSDIVRDINKTAAAEANLLFRGNTLLSKALDFHMQRIGKEYLEKTLGNKVRTIIEEEADLEIDPARASATASLQYNTVRLTTVAKELWRLIYDSVSECPSEIRAVLRHVKACAEDRFGDILRHAPYSAVSGFIFLRFFCPAILNPPLFGLVDETLSPRSQRNCTLLAKAIQGLANSTKFGTKEPWMEPMNSFVIEHRQQVRGFIDDLCSVPHGYSRIVVQPSQAAATTIFTRLPPLAQEGIPSLPFLIDYSRNFAVLVKHWVDQKITSVSGGELQRFHHECLRIHGLTQDCFARAEREDIEARDFSSQWATIARQMEMDPTEFWADDIHASVTNGTAPEMGLPDRTIEFAAQKSHRKVFGTAFSSSRPSTSPGRTDDDSRTRSLKGTFRFRSRSRSRPSSRQQMTDDLTETSEEEDAANEHDDKGKGKERPGTADKTKQRFWKRRDSEKH